MNAIKALIGLVYVAALIAGIVSIGLAPGGPVGKAATTSTAPAAQNAKPAEPSDPLQIQPDALADSPFGDEPVRKGANFPVSTPFARDTRSFTIPPLDGVEFNYEMEKGGTMIYTWKATDFVVWDFHGEPKGSKPGYAESYEMGEGKDGNGGFVAPTPGIHGWFWENQGDKPVTVTLSTVGHFTGGVQIMGDGTRVNKPLTKR